MNKLNKLNKTTLKTIPFFSFLSDKEIDKLANETQEISYKKTSLVFSQGDICKGFYIVKNGKVKIYKMSLEGREHIIEIISPGNLFALVPVLDKGRYPAFASTIEDSTLLLISNQVINTITNSNIRVKEEMLKFVSNKIRNFTQKLEDLSLKSVSSRLAKYILNNSSKTNVCKLNITYETLASHLGTVREVISRGLIELEKQNIIKVDKKNILILNKSHLEELT